MPGVIVALPSTNDGRPTTASTVPAPSSAYRAPSGPDEQHRQVPGAGVAQLAGQPVQREAHAGAALRARDAGGEAVEALQRGGGAVPVEQVGRQRAAQLAHDGRRAGPCPTTSPTATATRWSSTGMRSYQSPPAWVSALPAR